MVANIQRIAEIDHFLFYGQSLSVGFKSWNPIVTSCPGFNRTFAPCGPIATTASSLYTSIGGIEWHVEKWAETPCGGASQYITEKNPYHRMFLSTAGKDAMRISNLKKGSDWYNQWIPYHVQQAQWHCSNQNYDYRLKGIGWIQGFQDQCIAFTPTATYKAELKQLRQDIRDEALGLGLGGPISETKLYSIQTSTGLNKGNATVSIAQLEASEEDDNIILVGPQYPLEEHLLDFAHLMNTGSNLLGRYCGRAYYQEEVLGSPWVPLKMTSVVASDSTTIVVTFHVPTPPISFDTTNLPPTQDHGFKIVDDSGTKTINSLQVTGNDEITIVVNSALGNNPKVRLGLDYLGSGMKLGWTPEFDHGGGSTNIRDSNSEIFQFQHDIAYPMYNWAIGSEKSII